MEACCGGIMGMGETLDDRVALALELRALQVESIPARPAGRDGLRGLSAGELVTELARGREALWELTAPPGTHRANAAGRAAHRIRRVCAAPPCAAGGDVPRCAHGAVRTRPASLSRGDERVERRRTLGDPAGPDPGSVCVSQRRTVAIDVERYPVLQGQARGIGMHYSGAILGESDQLEVAELDEGPSP